MPPIAGSVCVGRLCAELPGGIWDHIPLTRLLPRSHQGHLQGQFPSGHLMPCCRCVHGGVVLPVSTIWQGQHLSLGGLGGGSESGSFCLFRMDGCHSVESDRGCPQIKGFYFLFTFVQNIQGFVPEKSSAHRVVCLLLTLKSDAFSASRYVAIYPYTPRKEDELELRKGEMFLVFERCQDGWFNGTSMHTSKIGVFPGNYVAPITRYGSEQAAC